MNQYKANRTTYYLDKQIDDEGINLTLEGASEFHEPPRKGVVSIRWVAQDGSAFDFVKGLPDPYQEGLPPIATYRIQAGFKGLEAFDLALIQEAAAAFFAESGNYGKIILNYTIVDRVDSSPLFFKQLMSEALHQLMESK